MARSTMAWLITEVQILIDDEAKTYFSDDQVQDVLDRTRLPHVDRELLERDREDKVYESVHRDFEGDESTWSGDTTIALWDSTSTDATEVTPDSWSLRNGTFTFTTTQDANLWLDAYVYDTKLAASELLTKIATKESITPRNNTGGAIRDRGALLVLAQEYKNDGKPRRGRITRRYG